MKVNLSVVICSYNEIKNLPVVIKNLKDTLQSFNGIYEIIIVDDGSTDGTDQYFQQLNDPLVKVIRHHVNQGIGAALRDGYVVAVGDFITFLPADGQIRVSDVMLLLEAIGDNDVVFSYYAKRAQSYFRIITSKAVRALLFMLFGKLPRYDGTYLFKKSIYEQVKPIASSFVFNYEFLIKANQQRLRIISIETECLSRISGVSKVIGVRKIVFILIQIILLRIRISKSSD